MPSPPNTTTTADITTGTNADTTASVRVDDNEEDDEEDCNHNNNNKDYLSSIPYNENYIHKSLELETQLRWMASRLLQSWEVNTNNNKNNNVSLSYTVSAGSSSSSSSLSSSVDSAVVADTTKTTADNNNNNNNKTPTRKAFSIPSLFSFGKKKHNKEDTTTNNNNNNNHKKKRCVDPRDGRSSATPLLHLQGDLPQPNNSMIINNTNNNNNNNKDNSRVLDYLQHFYLDGKTPLPLPPTAAAANTTTNNNNNINHNNIPFRTPVTVPSRRPLLSPSLLLRHDAPSGTFPAAESEGDPLTSHRPDSTSEGPTPSPKRRRKNKDSSNNNNNNNNAPIKKEDVLLNNFIFQQELRKGKEEYNRVARLYQEQYQYYLALSAMYHKAPKRSDSEEPQEVEKSLKINNNNNGVSPCEEPLKGAIKGVRGEQSTAEEENTNDTLSPPPPATTVESTANNNNDITNNTNPVSSSRKRLPSSRNRKGVFFPNNNNNNNNGKNGKLPENHSEVPPNGCRAPPRHPALQRARSLHQLYIDLPTSPFWAQDDDEVAENGGSRFHHQHTNNNNYNNGSPSSRPRLRASLSSPTLYDAGRAHTAPFTEGPSTIIIPNNNDNNNNCDEKESTRCSDVLLFQHSTVEILPGLFLGAFSDANNKKGLRHHGVELIINVSHDCVVDLSSSDDDDEEEEEKEKEGDNTDSNHHHHNSTTIQDESKGPFIRVMHFKIRDHSDAEISPYFAPVARLIHEQLHRRQHYLQHPNEKPIGDREGNVLVHCRMGISRSASFILAYLILYSTTLAKEERGETEDSLVNNTASTTEVASAATPNNNSNSNNNHNKEKEGEGGEEEEELSPYFNYLHDDVLRRESQLVKEAGGEYYYYCGHPFTRHDYTPSGPCPSAPPHSPPQHNSTVWNSPAELVDATCIPCLRLREAQRGVEQEREKKRDITGEGEEGEGDTHDTDGTDSPTCEILDESVVSSSFSSSPLHHDPLSPSEASLDTTNSSSSPPVVSMAYREAFRYIKLKKPEINPNFGFVLALRELAHPHRRHRRLHRSPGGGMEGSGKRRRKKKEEGECGES